MAAACQPCYKMELTFNPRPSYIPASLCSNDWYASLKTDSILGAYNEQEYRRRARVRGVGLARCWRVPLRATCADSCRSTIEGAGFPELSVVTGESQVFAFQGLHPVPNPFLEVGSIVKGVMNHLLQCIWCGAVIQNLQLLDICREISCFAYVAQKSLSRRSLRMKDRDVVIPLCDCDWPLHIDFHNYWLLIMLLKIF